MNANGQPAVSVRDLERRFGAFVAVDRVSFDVARGEVFGFLGPNGAGKSTTIRMLCGLLRPSGGSGTVAGFDILRQQEEIKSVIGYMSQRFSLYDDLTVGENLDFYAGVYRVPRETVRKRQAHVLETVGLDEARDTMTRSLPGGLKQRLALGCAILHEPRILFLDEPTSGVDPANRRRFWNIVYELSGKGVTVFVTTHYMDEAEYCDRVGLVYRGGLVALGSPSELKSDLMRDEVVEIVCDSCHLAMTEVEKVEGVREAALFGRGLHAVVEDAESVAPRVRARLEGAGLRIERLEPIAPSLEDVFVSLIEARDRAAGPQGEVRR